MSVLAWLDGKLRAPEPPERLAAVRILVGAFVLVYTAARIPMLFALARHDPHGFVPVGLCTLLPGAPPPVLGQAMAVLTPILAAAFTLGWKHRLTGPLLALALFFTTSFASSWGMLYHSDNLMLLHVAVLGLTPAADAWSLDARQRPPVAASGDHGWPLRLMALSCAVAYFMAGVAKLRGSGFGWVSEALLQHHVAFDNVRKVELGEAAAPLGPASLSVGWIWPPLAWGTMVLELGAPLFVLAGGLWARGWSLAAVLFHWGIFLMMGITFPYPIIWVAFACMWRAERLLAAITRGRLRVVAS